jgi:hypothetical protein
MRRHPRREAGAIAAALDDARHKGRAVQLAHLSGDADVLVHERLVVRDHVLVGRVRAGGFLQRVRGLGEEVPPEDRRDELQEGDDVQRPDLGARRLAVEEEVEELDADGVALDVEPLGALLLAMRFSC